VTGFCKRGKEPSGPIKCREFLDSENRLASQKGLCCMKYRGADKSLARPGRKQATAAEDFDIRVSYL